MEQFAARARKHASRGQAVGEAAICWLPVATSVTVAASLMPLFQSPRPSARSPRLTGGSRTLLHCPVSPRHPHREPAPTSRGGAEERAAGGGAVVPGRQLHAVAKDHPAGGRDGPTWGLAAAAAPRHGLSRTAPAAGAWPYGRPGPSRFALSRPPLTPSASEPRRPLGFVVAASQLPHPSPHGSPYVRSSTAQVRGALPIVSRARVRTPTRFGPPLSLAGASRHAGGDWLGAGAGGLCRSTPRGVGAVFRAVR